MVLPVDPPDETRGMSKLDVEFSDDRTVVRLRGARHLDAALLDGLDAALTRAERAAAPEIVFENAGPDFLVGIDAKWVVGRMVDDDFEAIRDFVREGQTFLQRLDETPLRTVARVRGHVTGAGAEWAATCDTVIAGADTKIGLPETGLGIHPALGGTQRVPRRIGYAAARWVILTGSYLSGAAARALGWVDALEGEEVRHGTRPARVERAPLFGEGSRDAVLNAFAERTLDELRNGPRPDDSVDVRRALQRLARRAPIALTVADSLLRHSLDDDFDRALEAEIDELATVYATEDAMTGMRAGADGRRATRFQGR